MRLFYIIARWTRILFLAFIGSILVLYVSPVIAKWSATKLENAAQNDLISLCVFSALLCILCLSFIHTFARFRLRQARWLTYPPLPLAVIISFLLAAIWPSVGRWVAAVPYIEPSTSIMIAIGYGVFWLLSASAMAVRDALIRHLEFGNVVLADAGTLDSLTDEQLAAWFAREQPIRFPAEDLFGFWDFTDTVLQKLWREGNTIALQGGFGTGKTSFVHLLQHRATQRRAPVYFARVSCWGFEEAVAAQKSVLSTLVKTTNENVECLSIRQLPNEYVSVASKKLEWLSLFASVDENPVEQLQRLSPILTAIGRRIVVVVEDVDRAGQKFDISTVFALLAQFREVRNLAFILTISPHQAADFGRLCEFTEFLPVPTPSAVAMLCQRIRDQLIKAFPDDILVDQVKDLAGAERIEALAAVMMPGVKGWPSAVVQLLRVPRFLKRALRRLSEAWQTLHGEVSIDALLMTCALREAAPPAFSFLQAELDDLLTAANQTSTTDRSDNEYMTNLRRDLKKRWQAVADRQEFDVRPVEVLIQHLFPGTSFLSELRVFPTVLKQGPSGDRAKTYALRLFTERVEVTE